MQLKLVALASLRPITASHSYVKLNIVIVVIFQYINDKATYETGIQNVCFTCKRIMFTAVASYEVTEVRTSVIFLYSKIKCQAL